MNEKMTLPRLARILAQQTGRSASLCEQLLKRFFAMIAGGLSEGEAVRVKGFGTFKITPVKSRRSVDVTTGEANEIPAHDKIVFIPSKEMAAAVNAPFEMFDSVEIADEMTDSEWIEAESEGEDILADSIIGSEILERQKAEEAEKEVEKRAAEALQLADDEASEEAEAPETSVEPLQPEESETPAESEEPEETEEPNTSETSDEHEAAQVLHAAEGSVISEKIEERSRHKHKGGFGKGLLIGVLSTVAVLAIVVLSLLALFKDSVKIDFGAPTEEVEKAETLDAMEGNADAEVNAGVPALVEDVPGQVVAAEDVAPTKPSDSEKVVMGTITKTRYLTTMAKDHYGNYHLWPYIYEANKKILGHPDRIKPGTAVVIPPLSRYGVDPSNPEDIAKAKRKGSEIYARYQ